MLQLWPISSRLNSKPGGTTTSADGAAQSQALSRGDLFEVVPALTEEVKKVRGYGSEERRLTSRPPAPERLPNGSLVSGEGVSYSA